MCVATSGKVVSVEGTTATVDFRGNLITARTGLVCVQSGDYVLVHAGCILQKLKQEEHESLEELFQEIENL